VLALENLDSQIFKNEKINLGSGKGYSVREVLKAVETVTGKRVPCKVTHRRPGDPAFLIAQTAKAKKFLNFSPEFDLETMIATAWKWHNKNKPTEL
jgi:UDP-glucose 4-epimerase